MLLEKLNKVNLWLEKLLSYPGIIHKSLEFKKLYWLIAYSVFIYVAILTYVTWKLNIPTLKLYGFLLMGCYIPVLILFIILPYKLEWLAHMAQNYALVITLYITIKLGGIPNCGGIIFAALCTVIISVIFRSFLWSIWYFSLFIAGVGIVYLLQVIDPVFPQLTPNINQLFFLINTLFISALTFIVVLAHIKQRSTAEQAETKKLKEIDEIKTKLYTNITHEFRTPLTVILGMTDQIEENANIRLKGGIEKIRKNSRNLLNLVNQMLDLSKLEAGALPVHKIQGDIIKFLRYLIDSFHSLAEQKKIQIVFSTKKDSLLMDYDPEKILQIVSNLIINAIKYTSENGIIEILAIISTEDQNITIKIKDTGVGISKEYLDHIFDRFYRIENETMYKTTGSGLGLSLTKELVELMGGKISVYSQLGLGTEFIVKLPVTNVEAVETDSEPDDFSANYNELQVKSAGIRPLKRKTKNEQPILLIVEDNSDVSIYLESILEKHYRILIADNGKLGLEKAVESVPDIILSDIMMPQMDGIDMLKHLKNDVRTSHIPVVLLTAKVDINSKLEGLETGADAYLAKPFNKKELFIRLRKLVELRNKLQERYTSFQLPEISNNKQIQTEDNFMHKLHEIFEKRLGDENLGIHQLCNEMFMSRAQLYRKFKALTNRSIMGYLRSFRLQKAKSLLQTTNLNVTEIAFEVGFKNLSHFSHIFHQEFGTNPSNLKHKT